APLAAPDLRRRSSEDGRPRAVPARPHLRAGEGSGVLRASVRRSRAGHDRLAQRGGLRSRDAVRAARRTRRRGLIGSSRRKVAFPAGACPSAAVDTSQHAASDSERASTPPTSGARDALLCGALLLAVWSYTALRAQRLSLTHDEALTCLIHVPASLGDILLH